MTCLYISIDARVTSSSSYEDGCTGADSCTGENSPYLAAAAFFLGVWGESKPSLPFARPFANDDRLCVEPFELVWACECEWPCPWPWLCALALYSAYGERTAPYSCPLMSGLWCWCPDVGLVPSSTGDKALERPLRCGDGAVK